MKAEKSKSQKPFSTSICFSSRCTTYRYLTVLLE
jgi:hypothetical protein